MASAATIRQADAVVRSHHSGLNAAARHIVLAIGLLETGFGVDGSWLLEDGTPSYNWGGLVGSGTAGSLVHKDRNPDGSPTEYKFKAFNNMGEAFDAFYATWSHGNVKGIGHPDVKAEETVLPAAARGDARAVAATMYAHGYYGGIAGKADDRIDAYAKAIDGAARTVSAALGEKSGVTLSAKGSGNKLGPLVATRTKAAAIAAGLGTAAYLALSAPLLPVAIGAGLLYHVLRRDRKAKGGSTRETA